MDPLDFYILTFSPVFCVAELGTVLLSCFGSFLFSFMFLDFCGVTGGIMVLSTCHKGTILAALNIPEGPVIM